MFIYLSKKIAIPSCIRINAMAWNNEDGFIAIGGNDGLLKVLKLDTGNENEPAGVKRGVGASSNLSMNEALEGHADNIRVITWNEPHKRLTTSDESGVIIVWMLYKGTWCEEMINNRKKSTVTDMSWNKDGTRICIVYEDGGVIVGSVDGNRIWGKELKNLHLEKVQWSPDSKLLLFGLKTGQLHLYDNQGHFLMNIAFEEISTFRNTNIAGLDWCSARQENVTGTCPSLAVCYENGFVYILRNAHDTCPLEIDMKMLTVHCSWNHTGTMLAIAGRTIEGEKEMNVIRFYSPKGEHMRTLRVPGQNISCTAWESGSLRIALTVESYIYFANVRPDYKWAYFNKTLVFASEQPNSGMRVVFWNLNSNQHHTKFVPPVVDIVASSENCALALRIEDSENTSVMICDTFGTVLDGQLIHMEIAHLAMNDSFVVAACKYNFLIWCYNTPKSVFSAVRHSKLRAYNIDNINPLKVTMSDDGIIELETNKQKYEDGIACMACSKYLLLVGRESGIIHQYSMPDGTLVRRHVLSNKPYKIAINCNSTRASFIDALGLFQVLDLTDTHLLEKNDNKIERKDVWAMLWASDNPQSFAIMEKARMYVFKGLYPEEPISCSGYICSFNDLEIKAVMLDEMVENPDVLIKDMIVQLEVKSLRDTRQLLENVGIAEAKKFIEDNPHPRLWRLLAEAALKELDLDTAEFAFIKSQNYPGILLINKLRKVPDVELHKAFIALFLKHFDEADKRFMEMDRADLALNFQQTIGDWDRVMELIGTTDSAHQDDLLVTAYNAIGDDFAHTQNWTAALDYYNFARNSERIIECYCHLDDYKALEEILEMLVEGDALIEKIAKKFAADAVFPQVVSAYEKLGRIETAKNYCILHNRWSHAFKLSTKHNLTDIPDLFTKHSTDLISQNQLTLAIEINIDAKYFKHAALHTFKMAKAECNKNPKDCLKIHKLYVYGALLHNRHIQQNPKDGASAFLNVWKGAEAFYFFRKMNHLYSQGEYYDAMCLAYALQDYTDFIPALDVYSVLAETAHGAEHYAICSKALMKLETAKDATEFQKSKANAMALQLFKNTKPVNVGERKENCFSCHAEISNWCTFCPKCDMKFKTCIVTGRPIISSSDFWQCNVCSNCAFEDKIKTYRVCPLCHSEIHY